MSQQFDRADPSTWPYAMSLRDFMVATNTGKNKALGLVQSGDLPAKKVRGTWIITKDALLKWLEA